MIKPIGRKGSQPVFIISLNIHIHVGTRHMKIFYIKLLVCCETNGIFNAKNAEYCTFTPCKLQEEHVIYFRSRFKKKKKHSPPPTNYMVILLLVLS